MDTTEKHKLLVNIRNIKMDLYALKEYVDALNTQKIGKPMTTALAEVTLSTVLPTGDEEGEIQQLAGGKRKASSKKRKSKKRKSKKRKSKTRRRR